MSELEKMGTEHAHISAILAAHIARTKYENLPQQATLITKLCILDALGVSIAASQLGEGCRPFIDVAIEQKGPTACTILGYGQRVGVEAAAFANGALAHALDFGDEHDAVLLHPNAQSIPAALAISEAHGPVDGREFIAAIALGADVVCRLAAALRVSISDFGWYPPPIFAAFGATAAAARLLRLTERQITDAMSLTLCQAVCSGEIRHNPHSVIRAVRDAFGARAGVTSALLARKDVAGFETPFEGRAGFFAMYARGEYDPAKLLQGIGETYGIESISFKPWPACRGTHAAIEAALDLRRTEHFDLDDVRAIEVCGGRMMLMLSEPIESKRAPTTVIDAKFSVPFTVGTALVRGRVGLEDFSSVALRDSSVLQLSKLVGFRCDTSLPVHSLASTVRISMRDGSTLERSVEMPKGSPQNPMSQDLLVSKFVDCSRWSLHPLRPGLAERITEVVLNLEKVRDVRQELMQLLARQQ